MSKLNFEDMMEALLASIVIAGIVATIFYWGNF